MVHASVSAAHEVIHTTNRDPRWLGFVAKAGPTLFQHPEWGSMIESVYGFPACVAMLVRGARIIGGLPYAEVKDFRGCRRVAYAFADVCEPLGEDAWSGLERALTTDGIPWQIRSRAVPFALARTVDRPGMHQAIDLPATADEARKRFHQKQRVNARRLERAGACCRKFSDASFIGPFYELFSALRKNKFRLLPQSRRHFELVAERYFPRGGFGLAAELDGRMVAGMMLLPEGDTLYIKYSASALDALELRPNNYLFSKAIDAAIESGFRRLDLGISVEPGLIRFKEHLGARSTPYHVARYGHEPPNESVRQLESALEHITKILTDPEVPLSAAVAGGDALYRFFV